MTVINDHWTNPLSGLLVRCQPSQGAAGRMTYGPTWVCSGRSAQDAVALLRNMEIHVKRRQTPRAPRPLLRKALSNHRTHPNITCPITAGWAGLRSTGLTLHKCVRAAVWRSWGNSCVSWGNSYVTGRWLGLPPPPLLTQAGELFTMFDCFGHWRGFERVTEQVNIPQYNTGDMRRRCRAGGQVKRAEHLAPAAPTRDKRGCKQTGFGRWSRAFQRQCVVEGVCAAPGAGGGLHMFTQRARSVAGDALRVA